MTDESEGLELAAPRVTRAATPIGIKYRFFLYQGRFGFGSMAATLLLFLKTASYSSRHDLRMLERLKSATAPLKDFGRPWFICGGWALDLYAGKERREHHDVDVGIFCSDQLELQSHLLGLGWTLSYIKNKEGQPWPKGEYLNLPIHEVWAHRSEPHLEFLLNEREGGEWAYRRDLTIRLPLSKLIYQSDGLSYLAPEVVLLYKSKHIRNADQKDFEDITPLLSVEQKTWLLNALSQQGVNRSWLSHLGGG